MRMRSMTNCVHRGKYNGRTKPNRVAVQWGLPCFLPSPVFRNQSGKQLYDKAGKLKKVSRAAVATDGRVFREGSTVAPEPERHWISLRDVVVVAIVMMLMLFALHCTWVTSNAYSRFHGRCMLRRDELAACASYLSFRKKIGS